MQITYQMEVQMPPRPLLTVRALQIDQSEPFFLGQGFRAGEKFPRQAWDAQVLRLPRSITWIAGKFDRGPLYVLRSATPAVFTNPNVFMSFDRESFETCVEQCKAAGYSIDDQRLLNRCEELFS